MRALASKPGSRIRRLAQKLALLFSTLLVSAVIIELCVRLLYHPVVHRIDSAHYRPDPWPFSFRFLPDQTVFIRIPELEGGGMTVQLNRHGFRGPDIDELANHRFRIVSIGDSFTFGWGLEDFADQCVVGLVGEYALQHSECDIGLSVVAEPGWGLADYALAYEKYAAPARPDLVILGFFSDDIARQGTVARANASVRPVEPRAPPESAIHCATLHWARATVKNSPALTKLALAVGIRPKGDLIRFLRAEPDPMPARWSEAFTCLAAIDDRIRSHGGRFVIISYPSLIQVYGHEQLDDAVFDYRRVDAKLETFCTERGITFIPFLPALLTDGRLDLFYWKDRHLTPRGQAVCKKVLVDKLTVVLDQVITESVSSRSNGRTGLQL